MDGKAWTEALERHAPSSVCEGIYFPLFFTQNVSGDGLWASPEMAETADRDERVRVPVAERLSARLEILPITAPPRRAPLSRSSPPRLSIETACLDAGGRRASLGSPPMPRESSASARSPSRPCQAA